MATTAQQMAAQKAYGTSKGSKIPTYFEQEVYSWSKEKIILKLRRNSRKIIQTV